MAVGRPVALSLSKRQGAPFRLPRAQPYGVQGAMADWAFDRLRPNGVAPSSPPFLGSLSKRQGAPCLSPPYFALAGAADFSLAGTMEPPSGTVILLAGVTLFIAE